MYSRGFVQLTIFTLSVIFIVASIEGCASTDAPATAQGSAAPRTEPVPQTTPPVTASAPARESAPPQPQSAAPRAAASAPPAATARSGRVNVRVTDIAGRPLPARIELRDMQNHELKIADLANGFGTIEAPATQAKAYIHVLDEGAPVLVAIKDITIPADGAAIIETSVLEGASGNRKLRDFDQDFDLALDRVELEAGTDPSDAASVPGVIPIQWQSPVLSTRGQWYRGDLHVHSRYGIGKESVGELVRRAERSGLDFMAITDRNTIQSALDPEFRSSSVVLIPAMEWGNDERGVGILLAPRSIPEMTDSVGYAQALLYRLQAQGGLFFAAHPAFGTAPWQWGLSYLNGVETWCRPWRQAPPLWMDRLRDEVKVREEGALIRSIALAAATQGYSANGQATWFYDHELTRGLKAAMIGGSYSVGPEVPLGRPLTYVYAHEKSLNGILDGLRWGRTFVSHGPEGPKVAFMADVLVDDTIDAGVGGYVPLNVPTRFRVEVEDAPGTTLQVLLNGSVFSSRKIDFEGDFIYAFDFVPENYATFRIRIVKKPEGPGFGVNEMLAMTSPIYALDVIPQIPGAENNIWLNVEHQLYQDTPSERFRPGNPATDQYREIHPQFRF